MDIKEIIALAKQHGMDDVTVIFKGDDVRLIVRKRYLKNIMIKCSHIFSNICITTSNVDCFKIEFDKMINNLKRFKDGD